MESQEHPPTEGKRGWSPLGLPAAMAVATVAGYLVAGAFSVGYYVDLPGIIYVLVVAVACCMGFLLCPRRPLWGKTAALGMCLPSLYLAVDVVLSYWFFRMAR
jgi:hypothetical protein